MRLPSRKSSSREADRGPQPGAAEGSAKKEMTDEVAVMVECLEPLVVSPAAEKASIDAYATSWARGLGLLDE